MSLKSSSRYGFVIGLVIGLVCLGLAIRSVDLAELLGTFKKLEFIYLFAALIFAFSHAFVMAAKWQLFLRPLEPQKFWNCFWSVRLGFFFNAVLPAKLGEGIRIWFLQRNGGLKFSEGIGALVADRLIDFIALMAVFYFAMNFIMMDSAWFPKEILLLVFLGIGGVIWALNFLPVTKGPLWIQRFMQFLQRVRRGFESLKQPRTLIPAFLFSVLGWMIHLGILVVLAKGLNLDLGWPELAVVIAAVTLASSIPSAPSSLGTFEFAAVFVLTKFFKVPAEESLALALMYHFVQLLITWGVGFIGYVRYHSTLMPEIRRLKGD